MGGGSPSGRGQKKNGNNGKNNNGK
jgi:hypothetical protein